MDEVISLENDSNQTPMQHFRWWHYAIGLGFVVFLTLLAPRGKSPEFAHLSVGSISPAKIIAPFDFEILKSPEELATERDQVASQIPPVYIKNDSTQFFALKSVELFGEEVALFFNTLPGTWLKTAIDSSDVWNENNSEPFMRGSRSIGERFGTKLSWDQWRFLFKLYLADSMHENFKQFFSSATPSLLGGLYGRGVLPTEAPPLTGSRKIAIYSGNEESQISVDSLLNARNRYTEIKKSFGSSKYRVKIDSSSVESALAIINQFLLSNLVYDESETVWRREVATDAVALAKGFVKQDELIIDRHIKVTEEHLGKLTSLAIKRAELSSDNGGFKALMPAIGQTILSLVLTLFLMIGIWVAKKEIWFSWRRFLLLFLILAVVLLFFRVVPVRFGLSRQLLPSAFASLLLTILLGRGVAALGLVTLALAGGFIQGNDFQTTTFALASGGMAIIALRSLQARRDVVRTGIYIAAVSVTMIAGFFLITYGGDEAILDELGIALAMSFVTPMLVLGVVPLIESLFGITTGLTLLELVDLNRPLLRQLALKSPGTYHHSLMVGSLAESAARKINANSLLVRAGAYYHDIGKMDIREFFIENQETGSENIHDRLPPSESARIVIDHIKRGVELADMHGLPPEIKMFITEHHGKTKLAYFYSKAQREQGKNIDESRFRYNGPKPQSRETGILMLADGIEAATRSLDKPSHQDLKEMVDKFVSVRLTEGDLDESPLTMREINDVKVAFLGVLSGIHHQRIQYPDSGGKPQLAVESKTMNPNDS